MGLGLGLGLGSGSGLTPTLTLTSGEQAEVAAEAAMAAASCRVLSRQRPAHTLSWWTRTSTCSWNASRQAPRRPEPALSPRATQRFASSLLNAWLPG